MNIPITHYPSILMPIDDRSFHLSILDKYPTDIACQLIKMLQTDSITISRQSANLSLLDVFDTDFSHNYLDLDASDDEIFNLAKSKASRCKNFNSRDSVENICINAGISPPAQTLSYFSAMARMRDCDWWFRRLRKSYLRRLERSYIQQGFVHRKAQLYISNESYRRLQYRVNRTIAILESLVAVNEADEQFSLLELQELSISNPKLRRNELMCRISGFEKIANDNDYCAEFITLTCPSHFHPRLSATGSKNPKYDGSTPRDGQEYLRLIWSRIRAKLHREKLKVFGIRVAEPHHDGTPHWHLLLFINREDKYRIRQIFTEYSLQDAGDESGAHLHRVTFESINPVLGTATGYIAKYISKNIDGFGMDDDCHNVSKRVRAWAQTWGIRQFQQIGGPPVGVWRELRRIHNELSGNLEIARNAADTGDWAKFTNAMGGPFLNVRQLKIRVFKAWSDKPNRYGEPRGNAILGVTDGQITAISRYHEWKILKKCKNSGAWSTVNNCTNSILSAIKFN